MRVYNQNIPFVSNLFRNRVKIALQLADIKSNSTVIDVGCGSGYVLKKIRKLNFSCDRYGIEIGRKHLEELEENHFRQADARKIPFSKEFFDTVFVLDVLEHIKELDVAIDEIRRVLKPNGVVILSGPTESWFYKLSRFLWLRRVDYIEHVFTVYDIEKQFESKGFKLISRKRLPGFPIPTLFRISKFKKLDN